MLFDAFIYDQDITQNTLSLSICHFIPPRTGNQGRLSGESFDHGLHFCSMQAELDLTLRVYGEKASADKKDLPLSKSEIY